MHWCFPLLHIYKKIHLTSYHFKYNLWDPISSYLKHQCDKTAVYVSKGKSE